MNPISVQTQNIMKVNDDESANQPPGGNLTTQQVLTLLADVFKGLGKMEGKVHLQVNKNASPTVIPPRRVQIALKGRFKEELNRLESSGVIKRVEEPTDWVSALVVTTKSNGKLRVCIDPNKNTLSTLVAKIFDQLR